MNETARIESLSDCIFSFAATLLVIELKPPPANMPFWHGIATLWPGYVSFVLSFFFIGIMWINHHRLFVHIQKADDLMMAVNLVVLLGVVFVPYPTMLMATSITSGDQVYARNVAILYNGCYLGIGLLFNLLWLVCRHRKVLDHLMGVEYARDDVPEHHGTGLLCGVPGDDLVQCPVEPGDECGYRFLFPSSISPGEGGPVAAGIRLINCSRGEPGRIG